MIFLGVFVGILLTGLAVYLAMPKMMLVVHESRYSTVEETCAKLKEAIASNGWSSPGIFDMNASAEKNGVKLTREVKIVELCKATYAKDILATNPEVSTLMPCAWGVYTGDDGRVYISTMNMGLMGKMFGGNIAKIMGGFVSLEEKQMLKDVLR